MRNSFSNMLSYAAALQCVETWAKKSSRPSCVVPLTQAVGRITATAIFACSNRPETDVSAMDGYAFAHAAMASAPEGLSIQGLTVAGAQPVALPDGYAQKILTGASVPQGADCVMAMERMVQAPNSERIRPLQALAEKGANIRRVGEEFKQGDLLVPCGQRLDWRHIALLACQKIHTVTVVQPLHIALVANGAELSSAAAECRADSNTPMLVALFESYGAKVTPFLVASDDQNALTATLEEALHKADIVVTTGGISVGMTDNVMDAFLSLGAHALFRGIKMRPGKPVSLFEKEGKLAFCLPGNPGASALCAQVLVVPYLRSVMGQQPEALLLPGRVEFAFAALPDTTHFVPVAATATAQGYVFTQLPTVGASDIIVLSQAAAFLQVNPAETIAQNQMCQVVSLQAM